MEHQYPGAISPDENMLAELMLPDQTHMRQQDWTMFFLHKDAGNSEEEAAEKASKDGKARQRRKAAREAAAAQGGEYEEDVSEDDEDDEEDDDDERLKTSPTSLDVRPESSQHKARQQRQAWIYRQSNGYLHEALISTHLQTTAVALPWRTT